MIVKKKLDLSDRENPGLYTLRRDSILSRKLSLSSQLSFRSTDKHEPWWTDVNVVSRDLYDRHSLNSWQ